MLPTFEFSWKYVFDLITWQILFARFAGKSIYAAFCRVWAFSLPFGCVIKIHFVFLLWATLLSLIILTKRDLKWDCATAKRSRFDFYGLAKMHSCFLLVAQRNKKVLTEFSWLENTLAISYGCKVCWTCCPRNNIHKKYLTEFNWLTNTLSTFYNSNPSHTWSHKQYTLYQCALEEGETGNKISWLIACSLMAISWKICALLPLAVVVALNTI